MSETKGTVVLNHNINKKSTPKRSSTQKHKSVPWWDTELKQQRKLVKILRKQKSHLITELEKETYRKERNKYPNVIRKSNMTTLRIHAMMLKTLGALTL